MFRRARPDKRQLDLSFETAEKIRGGTDIFIKNAGSEIAVGENTRTAITRLVQPEIKKGGNIKLAFVLYLLGRDTDADTIILTTKDINMMKNLKINIRYRNDGASNIALDTCSIPVTFPDGIDGSLTVDKAHPEMFSFDKNCKRGEDSN